MAGQQEGRPEEPGEQGWKMMRLRVAPQQTFLVTVKLWVKAGVETRWGKENALHGGLGHRGVTALQWGTTKTPLSRECPQFAVLSKVPSASASHSSRAAVDNLSHSRFSSHTGTAHRWWTTYRDLRSP